MRTIMENDIALEMLMDRVKFWTDDTLTLELYKKMYESYIDCEAWSDDRFDVMSIVDNDYVNWCDIVERDEENSKDFDYLIELWENGERDIPCDHLETISGGYLEAVSDDKTAILIRY